MLPLGPSQDLGGPPQGLHPLLGVLTLSGTMYRLRINPPLFLGPSAPLGTAPYSTEGLGRPKEDTAPDEEELANGTSPGSK